jgi:pectinesterase
MPVKQIITIFCFLAIYTVAFSQKRITVAYDGSGDYKTIREAIQAVPDNYSGRTTIFIKKGYYREKIIIPSSKINLELIGENALNTVISFDDYNPKVKGADTINTWNSFTFSVEAEGFLARDLTFENSAGRVGQGVAVKIIADQVVFINCRFLGNQDTLFAHGVGRMYFKDCYIEGTTDFIFGSAVALFENCIIHSKVNSYITAASTPMGNAYGFVFKHCNLTADTAANRVFLGRPWRAFAKTVFIDCEMGAHIVKEGWNNWNDPEREKTVFYGEFNSGGPGGVADYRVKWSRQLQKEEAETYTAENIFARKSVPIPVVGEWNPKVIFKIP